MHKGKPLSVDESPLQALVDELLVRGRASRITLRQESSDEFFPVTHESVAVGVRSIKGDQSIDIRSQPVVAILQRERRVVIQEDSRAAIPESPSFQKMLDDYEVAAQIVAPVFVDDHLVAILSVHHAKAPRTWTSDEISLVRQAVEKIRAQIVCRNPRSNPLVEP